MNKVWRYTVLCLLVATIFIVPISALKVESTKVNPNSFISETILNGGWMEERNGVKILHDRHPDLPLLAQKMNTEKRPQVCFSYPDLSSVKQWVDIGPYNKIHVLSRDLYISYSKEIEQLLSEIKKTHGLLAAMERSKFWKLRNAWVRFKQKIGLSK